MDPSQASVNVNQPGQTETITGMHSDSYNAAAEGKIEVFEYIIDYASLSLLLTPNKNTILHIYITAINSTTPNAGSESTTTLNERTESTTLIGRSGSTTNFVKKILKMCPSLLRQANANGETPLHIAARYGHDDIVEVLIKYCAQTDHDLEEGIEPVKEMLRMTNKEKDTALHEAVRYNHLKVVKLLIKEDPNFSYSANDAGETPLYIAAERGFKDVLFEILDKCKSPMHEGPLRRTALHAAVIRGDTGMVRRIILEKIDGISKKVDKNDCSPLHLAAYFDRKDIAELLLDKDRKVAYMKDKMSRTPLHLAAQRGCYAVVEAIVKRCPDCCEQVDNRGWNVLHFAIKGEKAQLQKIMDIIIKNWSFSNLLNEKNADGDTPLHFYSTSSESLELKTFVSHPRVDKMAFTKQHHNAMDIASTNKKMSEFKVAPQRVLITYEDDTTKLEDKEKERDKQDREEKEKKEKEKKEKEEKEGKEKKIKLQKASEVHLVVAALIATVTFAACITMPGGFVGGGEGSHPGSVNLRRNVAFKVFVTTDIISMVLSSSALFIYLLMPFYLDIDYDYEERTIKIGVLAFKFILWAMVAMGLAFVTGTYAVLLPSLNLAIIDGTIGLTFFFFLPYVFRQFPSVTFSTIFHALCPWKLDL